MDWKRWLSAQKAWALAFSLGLVLLTAIPYLLAASQAGGEFTGFLIGVEDGNSYIAKMLAGAQGDWLFRSPYSATGQSGALIYLPYILLGKIFGSGAQHAAMVLAFHIFRSAAIIALCFAIYDFLSFLVVNERLRRLGLVLITLGGGLGWLLLFLRIPNLFGSIPLDFYSPEAFGFLAIFSLPHLVLARALLLWGLLAYLRADAEDRRLTWTLALLWLTLALVHLITAVLGLALIGAHFVSVFVRRYLSERKPFRFAQIDSVAWPILGVAPVLGYNAFVYWQDSYLHNWAIQNQILSPNPVHYLFAWGLLLPFAYFGLRRLLGKSNFNGAFFTIWLILLPIMLYAPVGLQRRLSEGAWVMLTILALLAFDNVGKKLARPPRELWLFALAFPSTLIIFLGSLQAAQNIAQPVFRPVEEIAAFDSLRAIADPGQVVLTSYETGNALPAWTPQRVVIGHGPESVDLENLLLQIRAIYQGRTPDDTRLEFFFEYGVDFVFWGLSEGRLGSWQPVEEDYLELVVDVGEYQIFKVDQEAIQ
jgi:hypothetical protein